MSRGSRICHQLEKSVFPFPSDISWVILIGDPRPLHCKQQQLQSHVSIRVEMATVCEYTNPSDEVFYKEISQKRKPAVLRDLDIGKARELWTSGYLADAIGDTAVKIHVCPVSQMDFLKKNFLYK